MKNRAEVKKILRESKCVKAVFSGHQHTPKVLREDGITYYIVGSMIDSPEMNDTPRGVYLEIDTEGTNIRVKERHISREELDM